MNKLVSFLDKQANELKHELAARNSLALARQVENNEPNFTHLEVHADTSVTAEGLEMIAAALPMNRYITHVSFKNRSLGETSVVQKMAEFAEMTICLTHLRLADCKGIDNLSAAALLKSLESNVSVQQLALPGNGLSCSEAFASLLQHNYTIQAVDVSRNHFGKNFGPILHALESIPSGNLKGIFMTENEVEEDDVRRAHGVLEMHPKSATTLVMLQFLPLVQGVEPPLQRELNDLLHFRIHGEVRQPLPGPAPNIDEAVAKAKQAISNVAARARTTSFQKAVAPQEQHPSDPHQQAPIAAASDAKSTIEQATQTGGEMFLRDVCIQTPAFPLTMPLPRETAAAVSPSGDDNSSSHHLQQEILRLREALAAERLTREALTETLQNELEGERANSSRIAGENETLRERLGQQTKIVASVKEESNVVFEELRATCAEAYQGLLEAWQKAEQEREHMARLAKESQKMMLAMRATRRELDSLISHQCDGLTSNLDSFFSSSSWLRRPTSDAGCLTELTVADLEAYRQKKIARHEEKRRVRIARQMEEMRKKGPPVDTYAITLASELEALERAKSLHEKKSNASPSRDDGSVHAGGAGEDDDATFIFLGAAELDPTFAEMTKDRWVSEKSVPDCMACTKPFGVLKRKHHCRRCGKVFCDKCCPVSNLHQVRICVMCLHPSRSPPRTPSPSPSNRGRK